MLFSRQEGPLLGTTEYQQTTRKKYHTSTEQLKTLCLDFSRKSAPVPVVPKNSG